MLSKIKYRIKSVKLKMVSFFKVIKLENKTIIKQKNLSGRKLKWLLFRKTILHPIRFLKVLFNKELIIPYVEIVITTVCNLKCKGCSALMEYYKKRNHVELSEIINELQTMLNCVDSILSLRLLGGEPMCHPQLYEILSYLVDQDKIKEVAIVTNGTILIKDDRLLDILQNDKFYFSVSYYQEASKNYNLLINQLQQNNIRVVPMSQNYDWVDYGALNNKNRSKKELIQQFNECVRKRRSLFNGKLFQCYRCSHATNLNLIELKKEDYVDIINLKENPKKLRKELCKFIYGQFDYIESCKYCDCLKNVKKIYRGSQSTMRYKN